MKVLTIKCSPQIGYSYLVSVLFSHILTLHTSLKVRHNISQSYRTTGKCLFLCTLIFKLLDKNSELNDKHAFPEYNLLLI
jgi:hypothetical protein